MRPRYAPEPDQRTHYEVERDQGKGWAILGLTVAGAFVALVTASTGWAMGWIWTTTATACW